MSPLLPMVRRLRLARNLQDRVLHALEGAMGERLLELAEFAGHLAWMTHSGAFALPQAEWALQLGDGLAAGSSKIDTSPVKGRTLHVLSTAYETGGHTRLARRWMELMADEPQAVLLTRQRERLEPGWVVPAGHDIPVVDLEAGGIRTRLDKTAGIRRLVEAAQRVVLHIHPDDASAVAACHQAKGIGLDFLNHADHVAWLGAALPAVLLEGRSGGVELAVRRRGTDPAMCDYVPLPLTPAFPPDRRVARQSLGIGDGEVLLLTVATGYKYLPIEGRSLLEPLSMALRRPEMRLLVIGPAPDHPVFSELARRHPDQVRILGVVPNPIQHRAAADIYVDSFPFCSTTSLLENAILGTPIVAYQPEADALGIFYSDWPSIPRAWFGFETPEAFAAQVEALAQSPSLRESLGAQLQKGTRVHLPGPWQESMRAHQQRTFAPRAWEGRIPREEGPLDRILAGLGQDPANYPKVTRFPLGWLDRIDVMARRWRG